jgi:hypothetical protein
MALRMRPSTSFASAETSKSADVMPGLSGMASLSVTSPRPLTEVMSKLESLTSSSGGRSAYSP